MNRAQRYWFGAVGIGIIIGELAMFGMISLREHQDKAELEQSRTEYASLPPFQFTGGAEVRVRFTTEAEMKEICGDHAAACWQSAQGRIVMVNPCYPVQRTMRDGRVTSYWRGNSFDMDTLCHELAHSNGWQHEATQ